jgi:cyclopropane fatty-acyl-phospholipid synthase-like methyltransferase
VTAERIGREYYDGGEYFDAGTGHLTREDSPFRRYRVDKVSGIHAPGPGDRVLDMGCGWGTLTFAMAPRAREVIGVDFSRRSVEICEEGREARGLENVRFLCRDAGDTGLEEESFDLAVAADLLEHLYPEDTERVIGEAFRVLRPGGRFSIWTPNRGHVLEVLKNNGILLRPDPSHVDYKSLDRITAYLQAAGFEVEDSYYVESHLPVLRTLERALQRWVPFLRRRIAVLARKPEPRSR